MGLDLPAIQQYNNPNVNSAPPDMAKTMLEAQNIKQGALSAQRTADLPGAITAYQNGDTGALGQIYQANPEVANSLQNLALRKQEVNQEGALSNVEIAGKKQEQAGAAIDLSMKQRDQQLQRTQMQGLAAQNAAETIQTMRNAKADPSQIKKVIDNLHAEYGDTAGEAAHPELTGDSYMKDPDTWMSNVKTIAQHGQMAANIRAQMNMTPEQREFQQFQGMSPDEKRNYLALKAKDPYAIGMPQAGSESGASSIAPGGTGPKLPPNPNQSENENKVDAMNIDPAVAAAAKAFLRGDGGNVPGARAMPAQKMGWQLAQEIDGTLSAGTYPAKAAALKAYTTGQESHNLNAALTVTNHVSNWLDNMGHLHNGGYKWVNAAENATKSAVGPDADKFNGLLGKVDIDKSAVGSEAAKAYKGVGAITEAEAKDWQDKLSHNVGPNTAKDNAAEIGDLLMGKLDALKDQWNETHPDTDFASKFIPPKTVATLTKLGVDKAKIQDLLGDKYTGGKAPSTTATPANAAGGGVLHVDKNGNKAIVFPDGTYKEVP